MSLLDEQDVYKAMGVRRVINCMGSVSLLGASSTSPRIVQAMQQAGNQYAEMHELMNRAGEIISETLGAEATAITTGGTGGLVLSTAAVMTGTDQEKIARIPDTEGMKNEVLLQGPDPWHFTRAVTQTGAKIARAGGSERCTPEDIEAAIGPSTAAMVWCIQTSKRAPEGALVPMETMGEIARKHSVPFIIDGAGDHPPEEMRRVAQLGDLVCFGSKYIGGPNSAGYVCGRKDLIEAVGLQGYIAWMEFRGQGLDGGIGRAFKFDRSEVVAAVLSLQEWFELDHSALAEDSKTKLKFIEDRLGDVEHVKTELGESVEDGTYELAIVPDNALGKTAQDIAIELAQHDPAVWVSWAPDERDRITVRATWGHLRDGEEEIAAERLREVLTGDGRSSMDDVIYHPAFYLK